MEKTDYTKAVIEDGIYKSSDATYYVKDGRIMMNLTNKGGWFTTTKNFFLGATRLTDLPEDIAKVFDVEYEKLSSW